MITFKEYIKSSGTRRRCAGGDGRRKEQKKEASGDKKAYQAFFNKTLKKYGVSSPEELKGADKDLNIIAYNQAIVEDSTVSEKTKFAVSQFERIREDSNRYQLWLKRWDVYDQFLNDEGTKDLETGKTNYFIHLFDELELALKAKTQ